MAAGDSYHTRWLTYSEMYLNMHLHWPGHAAQIALGGGGGDEMVCRDRPNCATKKYPGEIAPPVSQLPVLAPSSGEVGQAGSGAAPRVTVGGVFAGALQGN